MSEAGSRHPELADKVLTFTIQLEDSIMRKEKRPVRLLLTIVCLLAIPVSLIVAALAWAR